jgi:small subunit ribosomal protein S2
MAPEEELDYAPTEDSNMLVSTETYLKSGIHIGTKFRTKSMMPFIYKTRPDGLSVLDIKKIDEKLAAFADYLAQFAPEDILLVSRRENGWKPVKMFGKATGVKYYTGRYPPGMLTNPSLEIYQEAKLLVAVDAWPDRNAISDAKKVGVPVAALCDTNNTDFNVDFVMPANNKGKKSLGLLFWVLAKEYAKRRGMPEITATLEEFTEE